MHPIKLLLASLSLALCCTVANAAPKDELHAAFAKFLKIQSFRATITDLKKGEQVSQMEFVAPDRYRMKTAEGPSQLIIGDAMYMDMDGQMMRIPVPGVGKLTAQYRNEEFLREVEGDMTVQALPDDAVQGEPAKVYAYAVTQPVKADAKTWISAKTGLPIQVESSGRFMGITSTTRVRYSDFNDPSIRIDAP
jgi:outer membrane lipoprotein-sorting protein